jgi:hypothetical protein
LISRQPGLDHDPACVVTHRPHDSPLPLGVSPSALEVLGAPHPRRQAALPFLPRPTRRGPSHSASELSTGGSRSLFDVGETSTFLDMLRRFAYLDSKALDDYVSALADGLRLSRRQEGRTGSSDGGSLGVKGIGAQGSKESSGTESIEASDTPPARFARLLTLAEADPDPSGWLDMGSGDELSGAGFGALLDFEFELHVPDFVNMLGQAGQLQGIGDLLTVMQSLGSIVGEDVTDLPNADEVGAMANFAQGMDVKPVIIGECDESEWKFAATLNPDYLNAELATLEAPFRVTAKVGKVIRPGEHKLLMIMPGASMLPREQRRAMEKKGPEDESERDWFIEGPARPLDVLAIYT